MRHFHLTLQLCTLNSYLLTGLAVIRKLQRHRKVILPLFDQLDHALQIIATSSAVAAPDAKTWPRERLLSFAHELADFVVRIHPLENRAEKVETGVATFATTHGIVDSRLGWNAELNFQRLRGGREVHLLATFAKQAHEALR